jgi:hypothetical protein
VSELIGHILGLTFVPSLLAFAATYYQKKGEPRRPVSMQRRSLSAVVIYVVCFVTYLVLTVAIAAAAVSPYISIPSVIGAKLIASGLLAYSVGRWVIRSR